MLPDRGRVVQLVPPPCLLRVLCAVVLTSGKGHCDAQTFVPKELSEPSLPPSSRWQLELPPT